MKNGEYPEKQAVLRMKMNLSSGNPYMWDTIAYRVKFAPHHRTGDKWSESKWDCCDSFIPRGDLTLHQLNGRNIPDLRLYPLPV